MKSFKFAERTILCGDAGQWDQLIEASSKDVEGTVIDLRTFLEIAHRPPAKPPEGWGYRRLPLTGATVSEQDLDVFRREFYRKPQTVVVGPNPVRAELMVAASVARQEKGGFNGRQRAEADSGGELDLLEWLTSYLVRHGFEEAGALEAVRARQPRRAPSPPKEKKQASPATEHPVPSPFEPGEATVEMPALERPDPPPDALSTATETPNAAEPTAPGAAQSPTSGEAAAVLAETPAPPAQADESAPASKAKKGKTSAGQAGKSKGKKSKGKR